MSIGNAPKDGNVRIDWMMMMGLVINPPKLIGPQDFSGGSSSTSP